MSKNRKTFIYVLQFGKVAGARIYRVMKNKPVFIGFASYQCKSHLVHVHKWLVGQGHININHEVGRDYTLEAV